MASPSDRSRRGRNTAFTVTELLIVIAIIAVLIAILVPSLSKARELARRTKCMANQRSLAQGVIAFALEHQGFGQVMPSWGTIGSTSVERRYIRHRYAYEIRPNPFPGSAISDGANPALLPWPIAYANYIGAAGLRSEDFFSGAGFRMSSVADVQQLTSALAGKRKIDVLRCPSEPDAAGIVPHYGLPGIPGALWATVSYSISQNIFGEHIRRGELNRPDRPAVWREGRAQGQPLAGQLDRVFRPADVLLSVDGGGPVPRESERPNLLWFGDYSDGGFWSDFAANWPGQIPAARHGTFGVVGVHVDGHADYLRPTKWGMVRGQRVPLRYSPNPRVSPYAPGKPVPPEPTQRR